MDLLFILLIFAALSYGGASSRRTTYDAYIAPPIKEMMSDRQMSKQLQECIRKGYGEVVHSNGNVYKIYTKANRHLV